MFRLDYSEMTQFWDFRLIGLRTTDQARRANSLVDSLSSQNKDGRRISTLPPTVQSNTLGSRKREVLAAGSVGLQTS